MANKNIIFAISRGLKGQRNVINIFIAKSHTDAIVYFKGYLYETEKTEEFKLHRIGYLLENFKIEESYAFIAGGYETMNDYNNEKINYNQIKLSLKIEKDAEKENSQAKIIEKLFNGKMINE